METKDTNTDAYTILESDEFDTLLDAVELMAKAQGNLLSLQRSVEELKIMMDNTELVNDDFSIQDNAAIYDALDKVESLVESLSQESYVNDDYIVTINNANLYSGSSTKSDIVSQIAEGQKLRVIEEYTNWYYVQGNFKGWINKSVAEKI